MTKSRGIRRVGGRHTRAEIAALPDLIVSCLKRKPTWSVQDLIIDLGFSDAVIRTRLREMEALGHAYYVEKRTYGGIGISQFWSLGPAPANLQLMARSKTIRAAEKRSLAEQQAAADEIDYCPPSQHTLSSYPKHDHRDPLVAALFGPAHREAA